MVPEVPPWQLQAQKGELPLPQAPLEDADPDGSPYQKLLKWDDVEVVPPTSMGLYQF